VPPNNQIVGCKHSSHICDEDQNFVLLAVKTQAMNVKIQ